MFPRSSGILLHPTSLPGPFGVGDLGPEAWRFADFLAAAGQRVWQVLPLGPTGYGDSPYQCFSASAGNPILISPEQLVAEGLLSAADLEHAGTFPAGSVEYASVNRFKRQLLERAFTKFQKESSPDLREQFREFQSANASWLDDYALFMALKEAHGGESVWTKWEGGVAQRQPEALAAWSARLDVEVEKHKFWQCLFFL